MYCDVFIFVKQKTAYEMRISDWSSDVCSSDLSSRSGIARPGCSTPSTSSRGGVPSPASCRTWITRQLCAGSTGCWGNDRKSVVKGKSVSVRVDFGGRRLIKIKHISEKMRDK